MKITIKAIQLQNLLEVHKERKRTDASVSDFIDIELLEATDTHNASDKVRFHAQSVYSECNGDFLGTN